MQKWEYGLAHYHGTVDVYTTNMADVATGDGMPEFLEDAGEKGWEFCGAVPNPPPSKPDGTFILIFKRPK